MFLALALTTLVMTQAEPPLQSDAPVASEQAAPSETQAPLESDAPKADQAERSARLLAERATLVASRPRLLFPILLTTGGLVAAVGGLAFVWAGLFTGANYAFSFAVGSAVLFTLGVVFFAVGVPLLVIGRSEEHTSELQSR